MRPPQAQRLSYNQSKIKINLPPEDSDLASPYPRHLVGKPSLRKLLFT